MKKLILSLLLIVSVTSLSYAQELENVVTSKGKKELAKSKSSGEYEFTFVTERTAASVEKAASYYTQNFTIDFNEETNTVAIKLIENTITSRTIIARFLSSNQVRYVEVDDESMIVSDFMDAYLK